MASASVDYVLCVMIGGAVAFFVNLINTLYESYDFCGGARHPSEAYHRYSA